MTTIDPRDAEIAELRATVASLTERLTSVEQKVEEPLENDVPVSRRHALRAAGVLAAGAIAGGAGVLASAAPAAAAQGGFDASSGVALTVVASSTALGVSSSSQDNIAISGSASRSTGVAGYGDIGVYANGSRSAIRLAGGGSIPAERNDAHVVGDIVLDNYDDLWYCVADGTPGQFRKMTGLNTAGSFHAVTPARAHDTRTSGAGQLVAGTNRLIYVGDRLPVGATTFQLDYIPQRARAISANITIRNTVGRGYLAINPGGDAVDHGSIINWTANGQTIANGVTLALNSYRQVTVIANSGLAGSSTDFIIDVLGYWL